MSEPYDNPFMEKSNARREKEKKKEREKNTVNSGHLVSFQCTQAARTKMKSGYNGCIHLETEICIL